LPYAFALLFLLLAGCSATPPAAKQELVLPTEPVKITQFYATPRVAAGEQATICYGVEAAVAVRIEPPVEQLVPSQARCFPFQPQGSSYKLIARGKAGDEVSRTLTIGTAAARPKFTDLQVTATTVGPGQPVQFCFQAVNAVKVSGGPGTFTKGGQAAGDCLLDNPKQTTTYRLTVAGADGQQDTDSITVQVK
jgi:hypothetical protein